MLYTQRPKKKKKYLGPVIVTVAFHWPLRTTIIFVVAFNISKNRIKLIKILTNGPNEARRFIRARFHRRKPPCTLNTSVGPVNTF